MDIEQDIKKIFKENDLNYEWDANTDGTIDVDVVWGDWKHDHLYLRHVMTKNGYTQVYEMVTEEDGDDAYSSIHTFKYGVQ